MQSLLRLTLGLALWPALALADSTVNVLPDAASPLSDGSCLYVDQGPGTDTKLCTQWGAALGISTAGGSTVIANPGATTAPASPVALPNCPDTGGNHLNWTAGTPGSFSCGKSGQPMTILQVLPTNPAANASGASQMTGMGTSIAYTPLVTAKTRVTFVSNMNNATSNGGVTYTLRYGTGTAPANGAAATGTQIGATASNTINSTTGVVPGVMFAYVALSVGTTYWFDIATNPLASGTITVTNPIFIVEEVP